MSEPSADWAASYTSGSAAGRATGETGAWDGASGEATDQASPRAASVSSDSRPRPRSGGSLTREKFLLFEMRTVAGLLCDGEDEAAIVERAVDENLFQYPTTKESRSIAKACLARLSAVNSPELVRLAAFGTPTQAVQVNILGMMLLYDVMWHFMVDAIGGRYRMLDYTFTPLSMSAFMTDYQLENPQAAEWTDATVKRVKGTLSNCLMQGGYQVKDSDELRPVMLDIDIEREMRAKGLVEELAAFNCF